jgi:hypothetical protein
MTPKEKAQELYNKYEFVYIQNYTSKHEVKQCVLIAIDEIIEELKQWGAPMIFEESSENSWAEKRMNRYWEDVKKELESF